MSKITRVGVDLAKQVIQVHGVDATEQVVIARSMSRHKFAEWCAQLPCGCVVAMEACSGAHHWARRLTAIGLQPRLIAPHFVTPYRMEGKGGKNDAADAAAICEAASRPTMRFVPVKSCAQQGALCIHRLREGYKEERTAYINRIRGLLSEFGMVFGKSPEVLRTALPAALEGEVSMPQYYLNHTQQRNGDYEVHQDPCTYMPSAREDLGYHVSCHGAVAEAKRRHPNWWRINGCAFCSKPCRTT